MAPLLYKNKSKTIRKNNKNNLENIKNIPLLNPKLFERINKIPRFLMFPQRNRTKKV